MPSLKHRAFHNSTLKIVRNRGHLSQEDLNTFYAAGYEERPVLEIILGLSQKVISNDTNHSANTPVEGI